VKTEKDFANHKEKQFSRRDFLKAGGAAIASAAFFSVLGACSPKTTTATAITSQNIIKLSYGSINPSTHTYSIADVAWIAKIKQDTGGVVQITPYWNATLLSKTEATDELAKGVADIGYCSPGYSTLPYPVHLGTLGFYYGIPDYDTRRKIYNQLIKDFPQIEAEFRNIKILCTSVGSTYQLITNKAVRKISDFQGLKLKGTGIFLSVLKALGAEGVSLPMTEVYTQLDKGLIDGCLAPYETFASLHFGEVAKYCTVLDMTSAVYATRGMNLDSWNKLPSNIQQIFMNDKPYWEEQDDNGRYNTDDTGYGVGTQDGVEYITLSAADLASYNQTVEGVMLNEAKNLDDQGLPGTQMYKEVRQLAAQYST
jgi:TRAP-type C4-dicarboxylate transport system substrate-binding protein